MSNESSDWKEDNKREVEQFKQDIDFCIGLLKEMKEDKNFITSWDKDIRMYNLNKAKFNRYRLFIGEKLLRWGKY